MREIKVDPYGIRIMSVKGVTRLIRLKAISSIAANILKQEMLSLGGDVAVSRDTLTGRVKKTDCLLLGSLAQFSSLRQKLQRQPFGLHVLGQAIAESLAEYGRDDFILRLGRHALDLSKRVHVMGIVNVTPDSFSGDGFLRAQDTRAEILRKILARVQQLIRDGADSIDIGGESSRPGAARVSAKEEIARIAPVISLLAKKISLPISIDTYKPEVAKAALECGAVLVNDICGLREPAMARRVASYKAGVVLMHMKGSPRTMQKKPVYDNLIEEITEYLRQAIGRAVQAGIDREKIVIDPGIGFGKTVAHNLEIMRRLREFKMLGRPILVGASRKSFIGKVLKVGLGQRLCGSVSASVLAACNGARMVRVHEVKENVQALQLFEAVEHS